MLIVACPLCCRPPLPPPPPLFPSLGHSPPRHSLCLPFASCLSPTSSHRDQDGGRGRSRRRRQKGAPRVRRERRRRRCEGVDDWLCRRRRQCADVVAVNVHASSPSSRLRLSPSAIVALVARRRAGVVFIVVVVVVDVDDRLLRTEYFGTYF